MCVMDFAYDFKPLNANNKEIKVPNNNTRFLQLDGFENEDVKNNNMYNQQLPQNVNENPAIIQNNQGGNNELDQIIMNTTNIMNNMKVICKKVEIITKITYT